MSSRFVNFCRELETRRGAGDVEPFLERVAAATEEMAVESDAIATRKGTEAS